MVKTRSGKSYGKKDIPLMRMHDLIPKIISKMPNLELVRMRRTCSTINSLVEKRTPILSKRVMECRWNTAPGLLNLRVFIKKQENKIYLDINGNNKEFKGDLKEHLGPFTINTITVVAYQYCSTEKHEETVQWFRQMSLSCSRLFLEWLPVQFTFDILDSLEHVAEANLEFRGRLTTEDLHLLASSRHVSAIELDVRRANLHKVPVEMIKKFKEVTIGCYRAQALRNMIEDIQSTNDCGNLEKIEFKTVYPYDSEEVEFPFPQLWDGEKPYAIYWKELQKMQMVVVHAEPHGSSPEFEFSFIEKGSTALADFKMENMKIKKEMTNFREDFAQAGFEEKCKLLKEAVYKPKCQLRTMCARRSAPPYIPRPYSSDTESELSDYDEAEDEEYDEEEEGEEEGSDSRSEASRDSD